MPYLVIQTNQAIPTSQHPSLLKQASQLVAQELGKPEQYVMVKLAPEQSMLFGGSDAPLAYLELKSLSLPEEPTSQLSAALCRFIQEQLVIEPGRIYIEFSNAERHMWGWNGRTF